MHTDIYKDLIYSFLKQNFNNFTETLDPLPSHLLKVVHLIISSLLVNFLCCLVFFHVDFKYILVCCIRAIGKL